MSAKRRENRLGEGKSAGFVLAKRTTDRRILKENAPNVLTVQRKKPNNPGEAGLQSNERLRSDGYGGLAKRSTSVVSF
jgi:hypothetical protein